MSGRIFYDGTCGLCHGFVRFVLARDRVARYRFAPLQGTTVRALIPEAGRAALPDSIVVRTGDGRTLVRSDAVLQVLGDLGGGWGGIAGALRVVPRVARDAAYDAVAAVRRRLLRRPREICPLVPEKFRSRFEP